MGCSEYLYCDLMGFVDCFEFLWRDLIDLMDYRAFLD